MSEKTNASRILDSHHITYELFDFKVDLEDLSAVHIAELLKINPAQIFKTLVLHDNNNEFLVAVIPSNYHVSLKKLAKAAGRKKVEMIPMKDLMKVTGYIRGGCSPVGMKKPFPTFLEESAQLFDQIFVSAGKRGHLMKLAPQDLITVIGAEYADFMEMEKEN